MRGADKKLRAVARHQLGHLDAFILRHLLDRPDPTTHDKIDAITKAVLIDILDYRVGDVEEADPTGWAARIITSLPEGDEDGDGFLFMPADHAEPFVPEHEKAALRVDVQRAAADLRKLRAMSQREMGKAYAAACESWLRTTDELPEADWEVWLAEPVWTVEEAAALLFGKDPSGLNASAKNVPDWARSPFEAMMKRLQRHVEVGAFKKGQTPDAFKQWLVDRDPVAAAALSWVSGARDAEATAADDKEAGTQTKDAFYRMILFVAVAHYGYDVEKASKASGVIEDPAGGVGNTSIPSRMMTDLDKAGVKISAKSLSKHLRDSLKLVRGPEPKVNVAKLTKARKVKS